LIDDKQCHANRDAGGGDHQDLPVIFPRSLSGLTDEWGSVEVAELVRVGKRGIALRTSFHNSKQQTANSKQIEPSGDWPGADSPLIVWHQTVGSSEEKEQEAEAGAKRIMNAE